MAHKADIFIPTSKQVMCLRNCLDNLTRQTFKYFRVILVSKINNPEIKKLIKTYNLHISYHVQKNPGLVGAANLALLKSKAPIFIRIDDDVAVSSNWFKEVLRAFNENEDVVAVTGPTLLSNEGLKARDSISYLTPSIRSKSILRKLLGLWYYQYISEGQSQTVGKFFKSGAFSTGSNFRKSLSINEKYVENLEACNFAVKTRYLKKFGGFDRTFEMGLGEYHEADLAMKIRAVGKKIIFNPRAYVYHNVEFDSPEVRPDSFNRIKNFIVFYKRHIGFRNADYLLRFMNNVFFQNGYYIYKFIKTGNLGLLGSIPGTLAGLLYKDKKNQAS